MVDERDMISKREACREIHLALRRLALLYRYFAETAVERGRVRALLNKMARFEDIKDRYDTINLVRRRTDRINNRLARVSPIERRYQRRPESDGRFDGEGQLARVNSPKPGAPRYALIDQRGDVPKANCVGWPIAPPASQVSCTRWPSCSQTSRQTPSVWRYRAGN